MRRLRALPLALIVASACGGPTTRTPERPPGAAASSPRPAAHPIPSGFTAITPVLVVSDVDEALAFYAEAMAATPIETIPDPRGRSVNALMSIGDSMVMLETEDLDAGEKSPVTVGGTNGALLVYVVDVDEALATALDAGAATASPAEDTFWGDRIADTIDPFGHRWRLATHREDVDAETLATRAASHADAKKAGHRYKAPAPVTPATSFTPSGYASVTVILFVGGASASGAEAVSFYRDAFSATAIDPASDPDAPLDRARLAIGGARLELEAPPTDDETRRVAAELGAAPLGVHHYVVDLEKRLPQAVAAGASNPSPVRDSFMGDRAATVLDPSGNVWTIATRVLDLDRVDKIARRREAGSRTRSRGERPPSTSP